MSQRASRRQFLFVLAFLMVVSLFVMTFRMGLVRGDSMDPTYHDGQVVLVHRRNWLNRRLERGDVVVLKKDNDVIIKRIYRLPGEEVVDQNLISNSIRYDLTDYYEQPIEVEDRRKPPRLFVPQGYVVVLGDNPRVSEDSRVFGPVPIKDILGVAVNSPPPPTTPSAPVPVLPNGN